MELWKRLVASGKARWPAETPRSSVAADTDVLRAAISYTRVAIGIGCLNDDVGCGELAKLLNWAAECGSR
jgi:hypothetical protein